MALIDRRVLDAANTDELKVLLERLEGNFKIVAAEIMPGSTWSRLQSAYITIEREIED